MAQREKVWTELTYFRTPQEFELDELRDLMEAKIRRDADEARRELAKEEDPRTRKHLQERIDVLSREYLTYKVFYGPHYGSGTLYGALEETDQQMEARFRKEAARKEAALKAAKTRRLNQEKREKALLNKLKAKYDG